MCVAQAARDGFTLRLTADTPVFPDERHTWLTESGTWGDIDILMRHWTAIGCRWVNLRFCLDSDGAAVVRWEGPGVSGHAAEGFLVGGGLPRSVLMATDRLAALPEGRTAIAAVLEVVSDAFAVS